MTAALLAACVLAQSPIDRLRPVSPGLAPEALDAAKHKVVEHSLGPQRQNIMTEFAPKSLVAFGPTVYAEAPDGRWLVGRKSASGRIDCPTSFKTLDDLLTASRFADLPSPPKGYTLREIARLPDFPTRLASDGTGKELFALCGNGDVWSVKPATKALALVLKGSDYLDAKCHPLCMGMALDKKGRLWIVANERDEREKVVLNRVRIYRTTEKRGAPKRWLDVSYPWGIGPFNHGVGHLAFGPDGMLYANSGSRTDGNESGNDARYSKEGETPLTACLWRLDPSSEAPKVEVYARGLRNAYGFCWNDKGEMLATDNGPDADPAEELNLIVKGGHYGFPYRFSDWDKKPYKYTPDAPKGQAFLKPILNRGPAGGGGDKAPLSTFDAHSSPSGIVFLDKDFPPEHRGGYLVARFGNLLDRPKVGFDVLHVTLTKKDTSLEARTTTVLSPIARPVDLHLSGKGRVYICEYSRQVENKGYAGMLPGRVLELAVGE